MIGPKLTPHDFTFHIGDSHLIVNDVSETCKIYKYGGKLIKEVKALARGQGSDLVWNKKYSDTPPGLYKVGRIYRDYENLPDLRTRLAYGWYSLDLIDLEGQESNNGRSGIMIHGGGSALGWPGCWDPMQPLLPTLGCIRMHNIHLRDLVVPLADTGTIYVSVYQES